MFGKTHLESIFRLWRNQVCASRNWKLSQRVILSEVTGPFLNIFLLSRYVSHIFAIINQLPGFSISRLAIVEFFLMYICFLNVNFYVSINDYLFKYVYLVCYLKFSFYCLTCSAMSNLNSADLTNNTKQSSKIFILKIEMLLEFQKKTNIEIIGF